jgi:hypothetical protein
MKKFQLFFIAKRFYVKLLFSFLLVCLWATSGFAQIGVHYTYLPASDMKSDDAPSGEKAQMSIGIIDIDIGVPLYVNENEETGELALIENSLGFRQQTSKETLPEGQREYFPEELYGIDYSISGVKSLSKKWLVVGFLDTGIYTDFENVDSDHFKTEGGFFLAYKVGESITLGLGPVYTYAFGNALLIPAPLVKYKSGTEKFEIDIKIPSHIKASYTFNKNFQARLAIGSLYNNYRLGDEKAQDVDGESTTIVFSDLTIALECSIRLFGPLALDVAVGTTFEREFTVEDHNGDELFDREMDDTFFFTVGLIII